MKRTTTAIACSAAALALGLSGCGASFEGSGSKDAASAEQLALRTDDPWAAEVAVDGAARAEGAYADGVYVGRGRGMEGAITVTLLLDDGRITCLETTQERGEPEPRRLRGHPRRAVRRDDRGGPGRRHRRCRRGHHYDRRGEAGRGRRARSGGDCRRRRDDWRRGERRAAEDTAATSGADGAGCP